jgi:predicted MPP superfamily phosphohydrolase
MEFFFPSLVGVGLVAGFASWVRGVRVAAALSVVTSVQVGIASLMHPVIQGFELLFLALEGLTLLSIASLLVPGLRPTWWRVLVDWPASAFLAGTMLSLPWAALTVLPWDVPAPWLPYALGVMGLIPSLYTRREAVTLTLGAAPAGPVVAKHRAEASRGPVDGDAPADAVRIVQITDPHLGTFMSVERLAAICQRAVDADPDLILLTGDYLTVPTNHDARALADALAPLRAHPHVYACPGNHDQEAPATVQRALAAVGARLLVDASVVVQTRAGPVEVVGVEHRWRDGARHLQQVLGKARARPDGVSVPRVVMLHDPFRFEDVPEGSADLVLSGHTHGGQVGLLSLGVDWTVVSGLLGRPDHGLWARGRDRLYVHRGTGHYGFPVRLGVPAEESVLHVRFAGAR